MLLVADDCSEPCDNVFEDGSAFEYCEGASEHDSSSEYCVEHWSFEFRDSDIGNEVSSSPEYTEEVERADGDVNMSAGFIPPIRWGVLLLWEPDLRIL